MTTPRPFRPAPGSRPLASGDGALDQWLGGGWPGGVLTEIAGRGRVRLALGAVRSAQRSGLPVAWVDGTHSFCPATAGLDLEALGLVTPARDGVAHVPGRLPRERTDGSGTGGARHGGGDGPRVADPSPTGGDGVDPHHHGVPVPGDGQAPPEGSKGSTRPGGRAAPHPGRWGASQALFAADILLRSRSFSLVVLDLPRCAPPLAAWFRLGRLARQARTHLMVLHGGERPLAGSAAALALSVRLVPRDGPAWADLPAPALEVRRLRDRTGRAGDGGEDPLTLSPPD